VPALLDNFLERSARDLNITASDTAPLERWVLGIRLQTGMFSYEGHEYLRALLQEKHQRLVLKKGSQMGFSESQILDSLHGMISTRLPLGVLYLFPTEKDVSTFSKARFGPLITDNPELAKEVRDTDSVELKRIRRAMLYLRGARATSSIEGNKKMSTQLLSIPVDRVVFDERDNMSEDMIDLAMKRFGHSTVQEERYLGTPSIPEYGVSALYEASDHRVWEIKCGHCGKGTILELEFPSCIMERSNGFYRGCMHCQAEIFPRDGAWITLNPSNKDMAGYWISRLNSPFANLAGMIRVYNGNDSRKKTELYNSELALPYIPAENRITQNDVFECCDQEAMRLLHPGPCAMGVDVGARMNVIIGYRKTKAQYQVIHMSRRESFNDLKDLIAKYNVKCCVIDMEPETHKVKEFAKDVGSGIVWPCDYQDSLIGGPAWKDDVRIVKAQRTEISDITHDMIANKTLILPRKNDEVILFAKHCSNLVRVLIEDKDSGSKKYMYKAIGDDHYRHALNYFQLASSKIPVYAVDTPYNRLMAQAEQAQQKYNPLTFGLNVK
jgi:hypothetical protein